VSLIFLTRAATTEFMIPKVAAETWKGGGDRRFHCPVHIRVLASPQAIAIGLILRLTIGSSRLSDRVDLRLSGRSAGGSRKKHYQLTAIDDCTGSGAFGSTTG
jgi:hypothetical protein